MDVILDRSLDSAKNGTPHENTANSNEIEARALGKATNKPTTNVEKTVRKRKRLSDVLLMHFELMSEGF